MNYHRLPYEKIWRNLGKNGNGGFPKRMLYLRRHVDDYRDPVDSAEHFKQVFTSCNFDSYADNQSATELKEKLSKMDKWESSKKIFHVMDIKHFHVLRMGRWLE